MIASYLGLIRRRLMRLSALAFVGAAVTACAETRLETWPAPPGEPPSPDYTVRVEGQPVFVYRARVRSLLQPREPGDLVTQRELTPAERAAFAIFDLRGAVTVEVRPRQAFRSARILPVRAGIVPEVKDGLIRFQLSRPAPVTLLLDDSSERPLHLFVDEPERDVPSTNSSNVVYFGPGVHETGPLRLESGQTLYVAGGAIVRARLPPDAKPVIAAWSKLPAYPGSLVRINKAQQVRIAGRGILDASLLPRHGWTMIAIGQSRDVRISGVTLQDAASWNVDVRASQDVTVDNVRILGARLNSDGVDIVNSSNITVRGCFVRSHDDGIIAKTVLPDKPSEHITVTDCQLWDDWGYALGATYETRSAIRNLTFRRCDVLFARHWAMGIHVSDSATVSDVRFEDIDVVSHPPSARPGGRYDGLTPVPKLFRCVITADMWGHDNERGHIRDVTLAHITIDGEPLPSELLGFDTTHTVDAVCLRDIRQRGAPDPLPPARLNLRTNAFVRALQD